MGSGGRIGSTFVLLAACGGGDGGDSGSNTASSGSGGTSTGSGGSSGTGSGTTTPATPTLATATAILDGTPLGTTTWSDGSATGGGTGQAVSDMNCKVAGNTYTYSHLSIYQNGQQLALPKNIGVVQPSDTLQTGCVYPSIPMTPPARSTWT